MVTKVFRSGNSQAVRIPKEFQLPEGEVEITRRGNELVIRPVKGRSAAVLFDIIGGTGEGDIQRPEFIPSKRDVDFDE